MLCVHFAAQNTAAHALPQWLDVGATSSDNRQEEGTLFSCSCTTTTTAQPQNRTASIKLVTVSALLSVVKQSVGARGLD